MDDLLTSESSEEAALNLIDTAITRMKRYDLNLCQVQSNAQQVKDTYPPTSNLPEVITLHDEDYQNIPEEETSSLGLQWHIKQDAFSVKVVLKERNKTRPKAPEKGQRPTIP